MTSRRPSPRKSPGPSALEVAKIAGVSRSAVSRAFTPGASVSEQTRARIASAAAKLGYFPNAIARSMITRRTNIVGLVLGDLVNPFYVEALESLSQQLQADGRHLLLFTLGPGQTLEAVLPTVLQYQVDAIVVASATITSSIVDRCNARGAPVILFNRTVPDSSTHTITFDNVLAGRLAAQALIGAGHRRLWHVAGHADTTTGVERERGFVLAAAAQGIDDIRRISGAYSHEGAQSATRSMIEMHGPPDGIFAANDLLALGAIGALRQAGLRVPDDVSVIGCDGIAMAGWEEIGLTTIVAPLEDMVGATVNLIGEIAAGRASGRMTYVAPPKLVHRRTVRERPASGLDNKRGQ